MKKYLLASAPAVLLLVSLANPAAAGILQDVKSKGFVTCGVSQGIPGFSSMDEKGEWSGLDVDYCRGIAAAVFGDASKTKFTSLSAKDRFPALQSGEIDVLTRNATWTISRDTALGFNFRPVNYYDGQGLMVKKSLGVKSALELSGATVCVQAGTTTELNIADYFQTNKLQIKPIVFETEADATAAYDSGRCDVYTTDQSGLFAIRLTLKDPAENVVLPEVISKEPLGPAVRQGDDQWFDVVTWVHYAMINAEDFGVTAENVEKMKVDGGPDVKRMLGAEEGSKIGTDLGLSESWAYDIIKAVGNYGESFDRNVGEGSPLKIERGLNASWRKSGLQYAPPIR